MHRVSFGVIWIVLFCTANLTPLDFGDGNLFKLTVTQDVWLEDGSNKNNHNILIVGKHADYDKKRSLFQFQSISSTDCPVVRWAKMYAYFEYAYNSEWLTTQDAPYTTRTLLVHLVKKQWKETEATVNQRMNGVSWGSPWLNMNNDDAEAFPQDIVTFYTERPQGFVEFDITNAVTSWIAGTTPNYGVLLWALDENVDGRDLRFSSNYEPDAGKHAFINVMCEY